MASQRGRFGRLPRREVHPLPSAVLLSLLLGLLAFHFTSQTTVYVSSQNVDAIGRGPAWSLLVAVRGPRGNGQRPPPCEARTASGPSRVPLPARPPPCSRAESAPPRLWKHPAHCPPCPVITSVPCPDCELWGEGDTHRCSCSADTCTHSLCLRIFSNELIKHPGRFHLKRGAVFPG